LLFEERFTDYVKNSKVSLDRQAVTPSMDKFLCGEQKRRLLICLLLNEKEWMNDCL